jgi:hypothetical protein
VRLGGWKAALRGWWTASRGWRAPPTPGYNSWLPSRTTGHGRQYQKITAGPPVFHDLIVLDESD